MAKEDDFFRDRHERERHALFGNEAFTIGLLQAVSGGAIVAAISQSDSLIANASKFGVLLTLTFLAAALVLAVGAAAFRHKYKMWDVKAAVSKDDGERKSRVDRSGRYLRNMRRSMDCSATLVVLAIVVLVGAMWLNFIS